VCDVDCGAGTHLGTPISSSQVSEQPIASNYSQQLELEKHKILNILGWGKVGYCGLPIV